MYRKVSSPLSLLEAGGGSLKILGVRHGPSQDVNSKQEFSRHKGGIVGRGNSTFKETGLGKDQAVNTRWSGLS